MATVQPLENEAASSSSESSDSSDSSAESEDEEDEDFTARGGVDRRVTRLLRLL